MARNVFDKNFVDTYDLPASYNATGITLVARDPYWIYAYWEISSDTLNAVRSRIGHDTPSYVLRMYDVTCIDFDGTNANNIFDIEVGPQAVNWYVNLWADCASYCAELGVKLHDGSFYAIARSNCVTTPRASMSGRRDQIWMEVKGDGAPRPFVFGEIEKGARSKASSRATQAPKEDSPIRNANRRRRISITDDDIRKYYSNLSPLLRDIISQRISRHHQRATPPRVRLQDNKKDIQQFIRNGLSKDAFMRKLLLGASEELAFPGASESLPSSAGASEQHQDLRSRKFFFEIWTELIVYGRTEPDAEVKLNGGKVDLRNDGTFTLRFALPDGRIPLGFAATSCDKVETREITTAVEREKTRYNP